MEKQENTKKSAFTTKDTTPVTASSSTIPPTPSTVVLDDTNHSTQSDTDTLPYLGSDPVIGTYETTPKPSQRVSFNLPRRGMRISPAPIQRELTPFAYHNPLRTDSLSTAGSSAQHAAMINNESKPELHKNQNDRKTQLLDSLTSLNTSELTEILKELSEIAQKANQPTNKFDQDVLHSEQKKSEETTQVPRAECACCPSTPKKSTIRMKNTDEESEEEEE